MPRCCRSMNGSPAISWEKRVQRWHSTHRSRSSSTWLEILIGLGKVRLTSTKRDRARPSLIAWFCSGHSPPLSHTGQSSGWLMSRSSITPCWAFSATGEVACVFTSMPSVSSIAQEGCGFGIGRRVPSGPGVAMSTRHWRQAPTGSSSGWSQNRGTCTPTCSAARITRVPLGTETLTPSMVAVTSCGASVALPLSVVAVIRPAPPRTRWTARTGRAPTRAWSCRPRTRTGST